MTHNERVLALLSDGKPHTHHEIYGLFVIGHSRIADLRKRGHVIAMWRDGDDYIYQLHQDCPDASDPPRVTADDDIAADTSSAASGQLSLVPA